MRRRAGLADVGVTLFRELRQCRRFVGVAHRDALLDVTLTAEEPVVPTTSGLDSGAEEGEERGGRMTLDPDG